MKKNLALILALVMCVGLLAACGGGTSSTAPPPETGSTPAAGSSTPATGGSPVELTVVTSYGQEDGNRGIYEEAYKAWAAETGNTVHDSSSSSDETWKAQVLSDFEAGSEPDVLFYFAFADGDPLVSGNKVVSLEEIRAEYPEYASNMDEGKLPASTVDGKFYCVPTTGFWEGLFVNDTVIEAAGVDMPGPSTTWEEFLDICQGIKDAGFTPIAMGQDIPHYWFEFLILNEGGTDIHLDFPGDNANTRSAWIKGLEKFKVLYERGFLPENYLTLNNEEAKALVAEGKAAFIGEGSWTVGWFSENADPNEISVTYPPGSSISPASEIIGGVSMGYYITRKAWDDPAKRDAAVSFVMHMTSDDVVSRMSQNNLGTNALKSAAPLTGGFENKLRESAYKMATGATAQVGGAQDLVAGDVRDVLFSTIPQIAVGQASAEDAVNKFIEDFKS